MFFRYFLTLAKIQPHVSYKKNVYRENCRRNFSLKDMKYEIKENYILPLLEEFILKECVFIYSALKIQCHIAKNTLK